MGSAADYIHRAGRVGRVGQDGDGYVLSILSPGQEVTESARACRYGSNTQVVEEYAKKTFPVCGCANASCPSLY